MDKLKMSRSDYLLKQCWRLLHKQEKDQNVLNLLTETIGYDGAECDGYCLMDDIVDCLKFKDIDINDILDDEFDTTPIYW